MNICFVCKYPPIQGGVSMHGYWTARGLAQRGHKVFVVTNANEVEPTFRILLTEADKAPGGEYARAFPEASSFVRVHSTEPPDYNSLYYIPQNNPTVTRLASIATDLIRAENCEVIFSYYLEPYGLAAHMASLWTGVPYLFRHAGSDLHRLAMLDDLRTAYVEVLHRANRIISSGPSREQILSYGVPKERISSSISFELPTQYFHPDGPSLDIPALLAELRESGLIDDPSRQNFEPLDPSLPVLGIYGKLGFYKGSFDLLHAAARLIHGGFPFYLVAMSNGWQEHHFRRLIEELRIGEYVRLLPFLPHWRVPEFIRGCTAVAFLERDFPIAVHGPTIPSEVVACGKCLIVSAEVAHKQRFRTRIRNLRNLVIVPDPKEHEVLAGRVRYALEDRGRAERIGRRGFQDLGIDHNHGRYITRMESLLTEVAAEAPVTKRISGESEAQSGDLAEAAKRLYPCTYELLGDEYRERLSATLRECAPGEGVNESDDLAVTLGRQLLSFLELVPGGDGSPVKEVCRYEYELQGWERSKSSAGKPEQDGRSLSFEESPDLYVSIPGAVRVVEFDYDVELVIEAMKNGEKPPPAARNPTKVLFHPSNVPMKINDSTEHLVGLLAGGPRTIGDLFGVLCGHYGCEDGPTRAQLKESFVSVLEALYWAGLLELRPTPFWRQSGVMTQESGERSSSL